MIIEAVTLAQILKPKEPLPQPKPVQTVQVEPKLEPKKKPETYQVKQNDSLTKIAKKYKTTWERLYNKNKSIKHPDNLKIKQRIVIPSKGEKLKNRPITLPKPKQSLETIKNAPESTIVSGNLYDYHSCTWHAKSMRPDLPNNLGNADTWYANAQAQGFAVGSNPKVGAGGQQGYHVVFIEKIKGGQVYLSERNYDFNGSFRYRWANASDFIYIYN